MPRDLSGNYTLPAGINPVVTGTLIDTAWCNPTMADFAVQFNNVITRDGLLGATAPLKLVDGLVGAPGLAWAAETNTGLYRISAGNLGVSILGSKIGQFASTGLAVTPAVSINGPFLDFYSNGATSQLSVVKVGNWPTIGIRAFSSGATANGGMLVLAASRGASGVNTSTADGDTLGYVTAEGVTSAGNSFWGAAIKFAQVGASSATRVPAQIQFATGAGGTSDVTTRLLIDPTGNLTHSSNQYNVYPGGATNYEIVNRQAAGGFLWYGDGGAAGPAMAITGPSGGTFHVHCGQFATYDGQASLNVYGNSQLTAVPGQFHDLRTGSISSALVYMYRNGSLVGSIDTTNVATTYNSASDYRLKDIIGDLEGSGHFIDSLRPRMGTWKVDGSPFAGFVAHELQAVSPSSVTGEKDGERMQAVGYGSAELIANIVAELKSLRTRVAILEL
jgi:hypothetical protein